MKKVIIFLLTVAIAAGGLVFAHAAVTDAQDDLVVYPISEIGDTTVLEGFTASLTIACGDHLRWYVDYPFGGEAETEFAYDPKGTLPNRYHSDNVLSFSLDHGTSGSTNGSFSFAGTPYAVLLQAAAEQTPNGSTKTVELNMADYVDCYSPDYELHFQENELYCDEYYSFSDDLVGTDWHFNRGSYNDFLQHFRFPVQPGQILSVTVGKNDVGHIQEVGISPENGPELRFFSTLTRDGIWFVPLFQDAAGNPLPYESPEGHGIYFVPWKTVKQETTVSARAYTYVTPDLSGLKFIAPLSEGRTFEHMELDAQQGEVWMLTSGADGYVMTAIDLHTGSTIAELPLFPAENEDPYGHFVRDGQYLLVSAEKQIALVDTAAHALLLTAPDADASRFGVYQYTPGQGAMHFDGETLILADTGYYRESMFWAAAYRQDELVCCAEYDCSIMRGNDDWYYNYITAEEYPLTLK